MFDQKNVIIIDTGSLFCKSGYGGDHLPKSFRNVVGNFKFDTIGKLIYEKIYVGPKELLNFCGPFKNKRCPVEHGNVTNWDDLEGVYNYIFTKLLPWNQSQHPILLAEPPINTKQNREKMIQIMFEKFKVPALYIAETAALSLYATGRKNGVVLELGGGAIYSVPIINGHSIRSASSKINFGGLDLSLALIKILNEKGYVFTTVKEKLNAVDIKEKYSYVALDYEEELRKAQTTHDCDVICTYDSDKTKISSERFYIPELLFNPSLQGFEFEGIHQMVVNSIHNCESSLHKDLFSNIVLAGGSSQFKGLKVRLQKEIKKLLPGEMEIDVYEHPIDRKNMAWIGGSMLSGSPEFERMSVDQYQYSERGMEFVYSRLFPDS